MHNSTMIFHTQSDTTSPRVTRKSVRHEEEVTEMVAATAAAAPVVHPRLRAFRQQQQMALMAWLLALLCRDQEARQTRDGGNRQ
jgi:hypothetical protein